METDRPEDRRHPPSLDDLRRHARDRLPAYAAPKVLELVTDLPRTTSGKTIRSALPHNG